MVDIFRDQIWTFVGIIVTILVGVPFSYYLVKKQIQKKEISYEVESAELVKVDHRITDRLQVTFDGKLVNHLF